MGQKISYGLFVRNQPNKLFTRSARGRVDPALELGRIALGRYLQDSGHRPDFTIPGRYQEAVRLLCGEESIVPLAESTAESDAPDAVFLGNTAADSEDLFDHLSKILGNTYKRGHSCGNAVRLIVASCVTGFFGPKR